MFRTIIAGALLVTSAGAFASDVSSERRQAFRERPQKVERVASVSARSTPVEARPAQAICMCTK